MSALFTALAAVFLLMAMGRVLKGTVLTHADHWQGLEKLCFYALFPALFIDSLSKAPLAAVPFVAVGVAMVGAVLVMSLLLLLLRPLLAGWFGTSNPTFTSLFQGATRWNTFVSLAIIVEVFGPSGLSLAAVGVAVMIPVLNIINVWVMAHYASPKRVTGLEIARMLLTNPYILSCMVGIALNVSGITLWAPLKLAVESLSKSSLAVGLVVVGSGLDFAHLKRPDAASMLAVPLKLLGVPLLMVGIGFAFGLPKETLQILVLCGGVQTASNSYILARQMGGDAPAMASITVLQTLFCALTLPLLMWWVGLTF